jgi:phosphoribosyl 1,2-cyclic phosphodiesterase
MATTSTFTITYWGVTGTISAPLPPGELTERIVAAVCLLARRGRLTDLPTGAGLEEAVRRIVDEELPLHVRSGYGGNTTCVEVQTADELIILDCGTGFRDLGVSLLRRWHGLPLAARSAHILLTHPHGDHIAGTPYFAPYYDPSNSFTIWGTQAVQDSLAAVLDPRAPLSQVFFPPTYELMKALKSFRTFRPGDSFSIGSTGIRTCALDHPGGCIGFRLENAGQSYVFATDHEQRHSPDPLLVEFARDADVLYTEGQYTLDEYEGRAGIGGGSPQPRRNWGHSPVEYCAATAVAAGVRQLHVGHRDPQRSDADLAALEASLQEMVRTHLRRQGRPPDACRACIPPEGLTLSL